MFHIPGDTTRYIVGYSSVGGENLRPYECAPVGARMAGFRERKSDAFTHIPWLWWAV